MPPPVRLALAGVGTCASALLQGISLYRGRPPEPDADVPGVMNPVLGGLAPGDITLVAAFDVAHGKVGRDAAEAILAAPTNTCRFADVPPTGVEVRRGPTLDGLGPSLAALVAEDPGPPVDVAASLRAARAEVLVNFLPVGSEAAVGAYAAAALDAGCAFVNCMPVVIAGDPAWRARFEQARLPLIGDDVKSLVGATIVHRALAGLFRDRGVRLDRTVQLNVGGNADFRNMLDRERLATKRASKTGAVQAELPEPLPAERIHVGPSDHVACLEDRKWAWIRLEGTGFGGVPLSVELKLEVWDSPNCAGVVIDAVRLARLARDAEIGGTLEGPSAWLMKSPPVQHPDGDSRRLCEAFVRRVAPAEAPSPALSDAAE